MQNCTLLQCHEGYKKPFENMKLGKNNIKENVICKHFVKFIFLIYRCSVTSHLDRKPNPTSKHVWWASGKNKIYATSME